MKKPSPRTAAFCAATTAVLATTAGTAVALSGDELAEFSAALVAGHSGMCLDTAGTATRQLPCAGADTQRFRFTAVAGQAGAYTIKHVATDRCAQPAPAGHRTVLAMGICADTASQRFTLRPATGERVALVNSTDRCVDVARAARTVNATILLWACNGRANQSWTLAPT